MEILYRTQPPAYRGSCSPPQQRSTGLLSGFWCYLFGGGSAPSYRTHGGRNGSAGPVVSRCWWQAFGATPSYKTAPPETPGDPDSDVPSSDGAGTEPTGDDECPPDAVPDQILIW